MPKYRFKCGSCSYIWEQWHTIAEESFSCLECDSAEVEKLPAGIFVAKRSLKSSKKETGEATKEHIEKNREILKQIKREMDKKEINI